MPQEGPGPEAMARAVHRAGHQTPWSVLAFSQPG